MGQLMGSTFMVVLGGAVVFGAVAGVLGSFALLRRQALLGDALAHAALPGIGLAYLVSGNKDASMIFAGALLSAIAGSLLVMLIVRATRLKGDAALAIVLSVFFAVGIVLLSWIQRSPAGNQSGLDSFLFGQAATLLLRDVQLLAVVGGVSLLLVIVCYRQLKLLCFDRAHGVSLGLPMRAVEFLLSLLLVVTVVSGLQLVGVILVVATLILPAAAARQWTRSFSAMLVLAGVIGALSAAGGVLASASMSRLPTGPAIVVLAGGLFVLSIVFAPRRGLLAGLRARRRSEPCGREVS